MIRHRRVRTAGVFAAAVFLMSACSAGNSAGVMTYVDGWANSSAVPLPTSENLVDTMTEAYAFGGEVADGLPVAGDRFGYKFGCGADVCPFAEHVPLVGTLWRPMVTPAGSSVDLDSFVRGFVEGELAFTLASDVTSPITAEQAQAIATQVAPSVELPDFPFGDGPLSDTPIIDVIADNGIARGLVIGDFVPTSTLDVNSIVLDGTRNGETVLTGSAKDVTGGNHFEALALAIGLLLEHGREVKAGDVIITGTLGEPTPLTQGDYSLEFGPLGAVKFVAE